MFKQVKRKEGVSVAGQDKKNKLQRQEKAPQDSDGHKLWLYDGARC